MEIIKAIKFSACVPVAITQSVIKMMPDAMVVGRCRDCKWWEDEDTRSFRVCGVLRHRLTDLANTFPILPFQLLIDGVNIEAGLETKSDFGCVMWEAKDGT